MRFAKPLVFAFALIGFLAPSVFADKIGASGCPKYERRVYVNSHFSSFQAIVNYAANQGADGFESTTTYDASCCCYRYYLKYLVYCVDHPWYVDHMDVYNDHVYEVLRADGGVSDPIDIGDTNVALGLAVAGEDVHVVAIFEDGSVNSTTLDGVCTLFEGRDDADELSAAAGDLMSTVNLK